MKSKIILSLAAIMSVGLASCDETARLATSLEGNWTGTPTAANNKSKILDRMSSINQDGPEIQTITPTLSIIKDPGVSGGSMKYSAIYTVSQNVTTVATDVPFSVTANVTANANASWTAYDDDEINVSIDPASVKINVDPASVRLEYTVLTDKPASSLDSIKTHMMSNIEKMFTAAVSTKLLSINEFEDIKVKGPSMTLEIGYDDFNFIKK